MAVDKNAWIKAWVQIIKKSIEKTILMSIIYLKEKWQNQYSGGNSVKIPL